MTAPDLLHECNLSGLIAVVPWPSYQRINACRSAGDTGRWLAHRPFEFRSVSDILVGSPSTSRQLGVLGN